MQLNVYNMAGEQVGEQDINEEVFGITPHVEVMHQALLRQLANARLGTAQTKTRRDVSGGGRKPWRQKGTGRARQGSTRAPQWRKGGTVFGPHPRSYRQKLPKKMRRLALRSALSDKVACERVILLDELAMAAPKTKDFAGILDNLTVDSTVLVLLPERDETVEKSARNLPYVKTLRATSLNVADLLYYDYLVVPLESLQVVEDTWA